MSNSIPSTKIIGDYEFKLHGTFKKKSDANKKAKSIRANHYNARIIKVGDKYAVYWSVYGKR